MTFDELESLLRSEMEGAIAEGWKPSRGTYFPGPGQCCVLGAAARHCYPFTCETQRVARELLGGEEWPSWRRADGHFIVDDRIGDLAAGFDGLGITDTTDERFHEIGARLGRVYIEGSDE